MAIPNIDKIWKGEIKTEYEKTLIFPERKPIPQFMLCPIGLVGSGKSAVILALAQKLPILRIHADSIRIILAKNHYPQNLAPAIADNYIHEYLKQGFSIGVDGDCARPDIVQKILTRQKEFGLKIIWLHVNTPEEFILKKLSKIKYTWGMFSCLDEALQSYFQRKKFHQNLNFPFLYTFDTSKENFSKQIEESLVLIQKFLK